MALTARPQSPTAVIFGHVASALDIKTRVKTDDNGNMVPSRVFKKQITLDQGGPRVLVDIMAVDGEPWPFIPGAGEPFAVVVEMRESPQYGASLVFVRPLDASDVHELADAAGALAPAGK